MAERRVTQKALVFQYYFERPGQDLPTAEVVDWVTAEYLRLTGKPLRDPDRMIRSLYSEGKLVKVQTGLYRYDPDMARNIADENFTAAQKSEILKASGYRCAMCGVTEAEGATLHADHIVPRSKGGKATVDNGQALCSQHNNLKKNYGQTETCKRMYRVLYDRAVALDDIAMREFIEDVMLIYEKHGINSHIDWRPQRPDS